MANPQLPSNSPNPFYEHNTRGRKLNSGATWNTNPPTNANILRELPPSSANANEFVNIKVKEKAKANANAARYVGRTRKGNAYNKLHQNVYVNPMSYTFNPMPRKLNPMPRNETKNNKAKGPVQRVKLGTGNAFANSSATPFGQIARPTFLPETSNRVSFPVHQIQKHSSVTYPLKKNVRKRTRKNRKQ
jgi:hypothetical protein